MGLSYRKNLWNLLKVRTRKSKSYKKTIKDNQRKAENIVRYAYHNSDFYYNLYRENHIDINNFTLEELPIITKKDIIENYDTILTDNRLSKEIIEMYVQDKKEELLLGDYGIFSSGGSSGMRCHIPYDEKSMYMLNALTILRSGLIKPQITQRIAFLGGVNHTNNTKKLEKNSFLKNQFTIQTIPLFISEKEVVCRLNEFQPTTIAAYSYMLRSLAIKQINGELQISPTRMRCGGTPLSVADREIIKRAFGIYPYENYGASESLLIASECDRHNGMHINEDCYIVDFCNPQKQGTLIEAEGILITNPHNKVFPLIKYKLEDKVTYTEERCQCNSQFRRILSVNGREGEKFVFGATLVSPIEIVNRIYSVAMIDECRLIQKNKNHLEVRMVIAQKTMQEGTKKLIYDMIKKYLQQYGIANVEIVINICSELTKDSLSGKLVPFITMEKWKKFDGELKDK